MPTYRFYDRPEGWHAVFEMGDVTLRTYACKSEQQAVDDLNKLIAGAGLHKHMFFKQKPLMLPAAVRSY